MKRRSYDSMSTGYLFILSSDVTKSICIYYLKSIIISRISSRVIHPQFVSSHTDVSVIFGKPEVHPIIFLWLKTFEKCNPTDFKFYLGKLNNKMFPYGAILSLFSLQERILKAKKIHL